MIRLGGAGDLRSCGAVVWACSDFDATHLGSGYMSVTQGDKILVCTKTGKQDGYMWGTRVGSSAEGWFPAECVSDSLVALARRKRHKANALCEKVIPWSGVPRNDRDRLRIKTIGSRKDMAEKPALLIVADGTLLSGLQCRLATSGEDGCYIIGGPEMILRKLPEDMRDDILAGAKRYTEVKLDGRARVGYIPLTECGYFDYSKYGSAQEMTFTHLVDDGYDIVRMPTIQEFAKMYSNENNGVPFFPDPTRRVYYTPVRWLVKQWLIVAIMAWAKANNLSMIFCLGWNSKSLQILNDELEAQRQLVVELWGKPIASA